MKRILVGLDMSERAPAILREALELARVLGAHVVAIRAATIPIEFPVEALSSAPDSLPAQLLTITQTALDRLVGDTPRDILETAEARLGTPWQVLCDAAKQLEADLIVIGSHRYGALDRLLGTTAARVVNHAPCSVLVIREKVEH